MLDVQSIRKDFPILDHKIYDKPLIYFDNGATIPARRLCGGKRSRVAIIM